MFFLLNKPFLPFRNPTNRLVAHTVTVGMPVEVFALYPPTIHFVLVVRNMAALRAAVQTLWPFIFHDQLLSRELYAVCCCCSFVGFLKQVRICLHEHLLR